MGLTKKLTIHIIGFALILFFSLQFIFPGKLYNVEWLVAAFIVFSFAVFCTHFFYNAWFKYSDKVFKSRLFWTAFIIRLAIMLILLIISYSVWDMHYYVGAMDEQKYYRIASEAVEVFNTSGVSEAYTHILDSYREDISDTGFCTFQSFLMLVFGRSPVLIKLIYIIIASITVVRLYSLSLLLFDKRVARLSAILFMLFPTSWFFSAVMMKETTMLFLIVEAIYQSVKLKSSFKFSTIIKFLTLTIILFFFRSSVSILLVLMVALNALMAANQKRIIINVFITVLLVLGYVYFLESTGSAEIYYDKYLDTDDYVEQRMKTGEEVNPFTTYAGAPIYISISLFAPFPSVVDVPISFEREIPHDEYYYHVAGNLFWVVMSFFSVVGLYYALRYHTKKLSSIWIFISGYQLILLRAILFTSVRFTYPVKPFLIMMAAFGIYKLGNKKLYSVYLIIAFIMIIGWNFVRLYGRGEGI